MTDKPTKKTSLHAVETEVTPPVTVGNPSNAAAFAIPQDCLEEYTSEDEGPPEVQYGKPPKGTYFTVRAELKGSVWRDRRFYYVLELPGRDPYLVAPAIAKQRLGEDVLRPMLLVRYTTMAGDEGLWALKIDPIDGKANSWNKSAMTALRVAEGGKWIRLISKQGKGKGQGQFLHQVSPRTYEQAPPRYSSRTFDQLVDSLFEGRFVNDLDHEVWTVLDEGELPK